MTEVCGSLLPVCLMKENRFYFGINWRSVPSRQPEGRRALTRPKCHTSKWKHKPQLAEGLGESIEISNHYIKCLRFGQCHRPPDWSQVSARHESHKSTLCIHLKHVRDIYFFLLIVARLSKESGKKTICMCLERLLCVKMLRCVLKPSPFARSTHPNCMRCKLELLKSCLPHGRLSMLLGEWSGFRHAIWEYKVFLSDWWNISRFSSLVRRDESHAKVHLFKVDLVVNMLHKYISPNHLPFIKLLQV